MASELRVNTLKDASGNNSVGMSYVNNGSAKAHLMYDHVSTAIDGSFNISSVSDDNTGRHEPSFTSNVALGFATTASSPNTSSGQNDTSVRGKGNSITAQNTSGYLILTYTSTTATDMNLDASITMGDLV
ncbi:MAG: hypothetical protein ACPHHR_10235 [Cycloclasticus sp.]